MVKVVIVCGGRDFNDPARLEGYLDSHYPDGILLIEGGQITKPDPDDESTWYGTDYLARKYAINRVYSFHTFNADWNRLGRAAGPVRNEKMAIYGAQFNADLVAFWDGLSRGTGNMIGHGTNLGLKVFIERY